MCSTPHTHLWMSCAVGLLAPRADGFDLLPFFYVSLLHVGTAAIAATIKRQYFMKPETGQAYTKFSKRRLVANTIKAR